MNFVFHLMPSNAQPLVAEKAGDTLILNGESYDFSQMQDGDVLPFDAVSSWAIVGDIRRVGGDLHIPILAPYDAATQAAPDPFSYTLNINGTLPLPQHTGSPVMSPGDGEIDWPRLVSASDADSLRLAALADAIKDEVRDRILAEASIYTQINMAAIRAAGRFSAAEESAFLAGLDWIADMRAKGVDLATAGDGTYREDHHWPSIPAAARDLAAEY